jgi:hyaluronan synthase
MELIFGIIMGVLTSVWIQSLVLGTIIKLKNKVTIKEPDVWPFCNVIVPVFNEGIGVYETVKSLSISDYPASRFDVTVVNDCSNDDTHEWVLKAIADFPNITVKTIQKTINEGKQKALLDGFHSTKGDIFVAFDSDVRVGTDMLREFALELQDPNLGIVGGTCGVHGVNRDILSQAFTAVYYATFQFIKRVESFFNCISVVGGMSIAVRREVYNQVEPLIKDNLFMGLKMMAGEDRHITHQLTLLGYTSKVIDAKATTGAPPSLVDLYKQQLRWRRSGLRDLFQTFGDLRTHVLRLGLLKTWIILGSRLTYLLIPLVYLTIVVSGGVLSLLTAQSLFFIFILLLRLLMNIHAKFYAPDQVLINPVLATLALTCWMAVDLVITTPMALLTLDEGGWGTRNLPSTT